MRRSTKTLEAYAVRAALRAIDDDTLEQQAIAAFERAADAAGAHCEATLRRIAKEVLETVLRERRAHAETLLALCDDTEADALRAQVEMHFAQLEQHGRALIDLCIAKRR
jgi:hypothetical protein